MMMNSYVPPKSTRLLFNFECLMRYISETSDQFGLNLVFGEVYSKIC
jgi:hypothetical protein